MPPTRLQSPNPAIDLTPQNRSTEAVLTANPVTLTADNAEGEEIRRWLVDRVADFTRHHHDDHELWFIAEGKAKVLTDQAEHYVQAGDIVLTQAGDSHDVVEVYEDLRGFFVETGHPGGGRAGHLHACDADAVGHDVPAFAVPSDFPAR